MDIKYNFNFEAFKAGKKEINFNMPSFGYSEENFSVIYQADGKLSINSLNTLEEYHPVVKLSVDLFNIVNEKFFAVHSNGFVLKKLTPIGYFVKGGHTLTVRFSYEYESNIVLSPIAAE